MSLDQHLIAKITFSLTMDQVDKQSMYSDHLQMLKIENKTDQWIVVKFSRRYILSVFYFYFYFFYFL